MRTLLYIFSVRNAIKRRKDLFSLKRSATCAMAKNNLLKRFATPARAEVAQLALCASNCGMPTSAHCYERFEIIEKLYLSKALLKMAGAGMHPPHPPLVLGMLLNVCLLVLPLLFFEKFAGAPKAKSINMVWTGP